MGNEGTPPVKAEGSAAPAAGSAPAAKSTETPAPTVEAGAKPPADSTETSAIKGLKTDLFKARSKARDAEESAAAKFNSRLAALESSIQSLSRNKSDSWETPEKDEAAGKAPQISEERIIKSVETLLSQRDEKSRLEAATAQAQNWLLSREHLREDPAAVKEMADILQLDHFQDLAERNPAAAARAAYMYWCEEKGVAPDVVGRKPETPAAGAAPKSSGSPKKDEITDVKSALAGYKPGTPEYSARIKEIEQAAREGKIKGKVFKL